MGLFKTDKQVFKQERVKDILRKGFELPTQIQRDLEEDRVVELKKDFDKDFQPYAPIYFCIFQKQRYVIDGQHRLQIFKTNNKYNDDKIWICDIQVEQFDEMKDIFRIINNQLPMNELWKKPKDIKEIVLETFQHFVKKYPNSFKFKGKRRPYLNKELFKSQITILRDELAFFKSEELIERIEWVNTEYSKLHYDKLPQKGKKGNLNFKKTIEKENCLHLGMVEEWPRHCLNKEIHNDMVGNNDFAAKRPKVWEKHMGNIAKGLCKCCEDNEISTFTFEAGHIIARAKCGSDDIDNLIPICSWCNRCMGTENFHEYKARNFTSSNLDNFV